MLASIFYSHGYVSTQPKAFAWLALYRNLTDMNVCISLYLAQNKWVEVQIRTERMDEIAEHGLAAHWRYKGIKRMVVLTNGLPISDQPLRAMMTCNSWINSKWICMRMKSMYLHQRAIYLNFLKVATILDFAYHIHSGVGNTCVGGRINGKNVPIRETQPDCWNYNAKQSETK